MKPPIELSVVLPAYREEENLRILLPRLNTVLTALGVAFEILVVDTRAPLDATREVCAQFGARYCNREGGNAFGCAIRTGIRQVRGTIVVFMDADGSHTPEFIPKLFAHRGNYDVVIASRYVKGGHIENAWHLVLMSRVLNWTYAKILNLDCHDLSNSFRLYWKEQLQSIRLVSDNFDIVEEILLKLDRKYHIRVHEEPYTFKRRVFGETKRNLIWFVLTYMVTLIRLRFIRNEEI